jgi:hypothetical protein
MASGLNVMMTTEDLVEELSVRFGDVEEVLIYVDKAVELDYETIEVEGVIRAITPNHKVCSVGKIRARCSFRQGIYSNVHEGSLVHDLLLGRAVIFMNDDALAVFLLVPCELDVDMDKLVAVPIESEEECPHANKIENNNKLPMII